MRWSDETIEEAIRTAKARNAVFVVFVEDDSTIGHGFHDIVEGPEATELLMNERFVAIRIRGSSQSYRHFASIYQLVPVPSLFFIGENGWPLEIITGDLSPVEIIERIRSILRRNAVNASQDDRSEPEDCFPSTSSSAAVYSSPSSVSTTETAPFASVSTTALSSILPAATSSSISISTAVDPQSTITTTASTFSPSVSENPSTATLGSLFTGDNDSGQMIMDRRECFSEQSSEFNIATVPSVTTCESLNVFLDLHPIHNVSSNEADICNSSSVISEKKETENVQPEQLDSSEEMENLSSQPSLVYESTHNRALPQHEIRHLGQDVREHVHAEPERPEQSHQHETSHPETTGRATRISHPSILPVAGYMQNPFSSASTAPTAQLSGIESGTDSEVSHASSSNPLINMTSDDSRNEEYAQIQFRIPDGSTHSQRFLAQSTIRHVRQYVESNIQLPFREFILSTSYPRVEFNEEHLDMTLAALGLVPRSVILVIPGPAVRTPFSYTAIFNALWAMAVWPFTAVYSAVTYVNFWFTGGRNREIGDGNAGEVQLTLQEERAAGGTSSGARRRVPGSRRVQRDGNVHRLGNQADDSDDENNTWNGNSTQQM